MVIVVWGAGVSHSREWQPGGPDQWIEVRSRCSGVTGMPTQTFDSIDRKRHLIVRQRENLAAGELENMQSPLAKKRSPIGERSLY